MYPSVVKCVVFPIGFLSILEVKAVWFLLWSMRVSPSICHKRIFSGVLLCPVLIDEEVISRSIFMVLKTERMAGKKGK